ncbi:hypothetical protein [Trabulsiella odontotermitis]|uniref:hypothetical protein n=1 Tax=Trabulsiella odontotermitis TaxID=379893 RepID=UPI000B09A595|nr:hypothetical protein [Trabulsiella odontotermitis]
MQFTQSGTLEYGVQFNEQIHRDFEIRLQTVGDEIDTVAEVGSDIIDANFTVHLLARTLISLGSIPEDELTPELLKDNLIYEDYMALLRASRGAKKKLMDMKSGSETSGSTASSSENSDSPRTTSDS